MNAMCVPRRVTPFVIAVGLLIPISPARAEGQWNARPAMTQGSRLPGIPVPGTDTTTDRRRGPVEVTFTKWRSAVLPSSGLPILLFLFTISGHASAQSSDMPAELPRNLVVPEVMRPLVERMWRQSLTFRRQCARLAEHPPVTVSIDLAVGVRNTSGARATMQRRGARLEVSIRVDLRQPGRFVELIAHELEHVVEQIDGTDLPGLARQGVDGVIPKMAGYETARARAIGRAVAREAKTR